MRHTVKPPTGKCPLIAHTRKEDEERPICLNCPYKRCLLELRNQPRLELPNQPPLRRGRGRPPNPLLPARNAQIVALRLAGHSGNDLAARFNLTRQCIYDIQHRQKTTVSDRRRQKTTVSDRRRQKTTVSDRRRQKTTVMNTRRNIERT